MAKYLNSTLLLIVAISLMAINFDTANADLGIFNGTPIAQVTARGLLTCSVNASLPTAPPLVGVNVTLSCNSRQTTLGQAQTNPAGIFQIVLSTVDDLVFHSSANCSVYVQLKPGLNCTVFPPTGVLQSALQVLGVVRTTVGNVLSLGSTTFTLVNVA